MGPAGSRSGALFQWEFRIREEGSQVKPLNVKDEIIRLNETRRKNSLLQKFSDQGSFDYNQMKEIRLGIEKGVDVSAFAVPGVSVDRMKEIRGRLEAAAATIKRTRKRPLAPGM